jgi:uncharacterized protein
MPALCRLTRRDFARFGPSQGNGLAMVLEIVTGLDAPAERPFRLSFRLSRPWRRHAGVKTDPPTVDAGSLTWDVGQFSGQFSRRSRARWFSDFVRLVVERDALDIRRVRQRDALPLLLQRLAAQTASVLNTTDLARRTQMERTVVDDHVQVLEAVFMVHRLPAWGRTLGARVGRSPKLHLVDSGLAATLAGLTEQRLAARDTAALAELGHVLETFVVGEILKQTSWSDEPLQVSHFRTHDGVEVDAVIEGADGRVAGVKVKSGTQLRPDDLRGLVMLRDRMGDRFTGGAMLYLGPLSYTAGDRIVVLPLDRLWT